LRLKGENDVLKEKLSEAISKIPDKKVRNRLRLNLNLLAMSWGIDHTNS
jgi:hypothetical protein